MLTNRCRRSQGRLLSLYCAWPARPLSSASTDNQETRNWMRLTHPNAARSARGATLFRRRNASIAISVVVAARLRFPGTVLFTRHNLERPGRFIESALMRLLYVRPSIRSRWPIYAITCCYIHLTSPLFMLYFYSTRYTQAGRVLYVPCNARRLTT